MKMNKNNIFLSTLLTFMSFKAEATEIWIVANNHPHYPFILESYNLNGEEKWDLLAPNGLILHSQVNVTLNEHTATVSFADGDQEEYQYFLPVHPAYEIDFTPLNIHLTSGSK